MTKNIDTSFGLIIDDKLDISFKITSNFGKLWFFALFSSFLFITLGGHQDLFAMHNVEHIIGFAAAGDWGCNSNTDDTIKAIYNKGSETDFVFGAGDYSYQSSANCFINKVKDPNNNIFSKMSGSTRTGGTGTIAFGNHDDGSGDDRTGYSSNFNIPNSGYYSFNAGTSPNKAHFLVMSTEDIFDAGSSQYSFVVNDLRTASENSDIKWIIVVFHKPFYASKNSGNDPTHEGYVDFRTIYHPIFDERGVDLVITGHTHDYQRTFPIKYGGTSKSDPVIQSTNTNDYSNPQGIIEVVAGTGGVNFYKLEDKSPFISYQQDRRFGYLKIDITKSGSSQILRGNFYGNGLSDPMDTFTITKGTSSPPTSQYNYSPSFVLNGIRKLDVPNSPSLQTETSFTIATWFKTNAKFGIDSYLVSKGKYDVSENPGENQNYALIMNSDEKIKFSFESSSGNDVSVVSPLSYNDGKWHHATGVFDDKVDLMTLYIDGREVVHKSTTDSPDGKGNDPFTVGANSNKNYNYFVGEIDEVRLWNNKVLSPSQVSNAFTNGIYPQGETIRLAFNTLVPNDYRYNPYGNLDGNNYYEIPSSSSLQALSSFSLETWFKTNTNYNTDGFIIGKGGLGSEKSGKNQNYGIWINSAEKIGGGFETTSGINNYLLSDKSYNDNVWHQVMLVFDDLSDKLSMYIDGALVATKSTTGTPDSTGDQPLRIGANSQAISNFFTGTIDESRLWKGVALSDQQVKDAFVNGIHALGTDIVSQHSFDLLSGLSVSGLDKKTFDSKRVKNDDKNYVYKVKKLIQGNEKVFDTNKNDSNKTLPLKSKQDTNRIPLILPFQ